MKSVHTNPAARAVFCFTLLFATSAGCSTPAADTVNAPTIVKPAKPGDLPADPAQAAQAEKYKAQADSQFQSSKQPGAGNAGSR